MHVTCKYAGRPAGRSVASRTAFAMPLGARTSERSRRESARNPSTQGVLESPADTYLGDEMSDRDRWL